MSTIIMYLNERSSAWDLNLVSGIYLHVLESEWESSSRYILTFPMFPIFILVFILTATIGLFLVGFTPAWVDFFCSTVLTEPHQIQSLYFIIESSSWTKQEIRQWTCLWWPVILSLISLLCPGSFFAIKLIP